MRPVIKSFLAVAASALALAGCSNKINQTGAWLVSTDSSQVPTYFDSRADSAAVTTAQVNFGLATGTSSSLLLGKVPWTEADLLIRFSALDPVDSAQSILSGTIILYRSSYLLQPQGEEATTLKFNGFMMDSVWNSTTFTWDSVNAIGYGTNNIITASNVTDTTVVLQIDTAAIRQWAVATADTNVKNDGMIVRPQNLGGVVSVNGPVYTTTAYDPVFNVIYIGKDGTLDTSSIGLSYATSVAMTTIESVAPNGPYRIIQAGTGERENLVFDLSKIPPYSIVNQATLTLRMDSVSQAPYTRKYIVDSLMAYYTTDRATGQYSASYPAEGVPNGDKYTFSVGVLVQHMVNSQNNGFTIVQYSELDNIDLRFIYDENAPDSLRPRLTVTYTPTSKR